MFAKKRFALVTNITNIYDIAQWSRVADKTTISRQCFPFKPEPAFPSDSVTGHKHSRLGNANSRFALLNLEWAHHTFEIGRRQTHTFAQILSYCSIFSFGSIMTLYTVNILAVLEQHMAHLYSDIHYEN